MKLITGTRIEVPALFPGGTPDKATIADWPAASGPQHESEYLVQFENGKTLYMRAIHFRVVSEN